MLGGFLGGLANLGGIAGGMQDYQTREANLAFQQLRQRALLQQLQQQAQLEQALGNRPIASLFAPPSQVGAQAPQVPGGTQALGQDIAAATPYQPSGNLPIPVQSYPLTPPTTMAGLPPPTYGGFANFGQAGPQQVATGPQLTSYGGAAGVPGLPGSPSGPAYSDMPAPPDMREAQLNVITAPQPDRFTPPLAGRGVDWQHESPQFKQAFQNWWGSLPPNVRAGLSVESGYRTFKQQQDAYARKQRGETSRAAVPGTSEHEFGRAADLTGPGLQAARASLASPEAQQRFGLRFPFTDDPGHVELRRAITTTAVAQHQLHGNPQITAQSTNGAMATAQSIDPRQYGIVPIYELAQRIDQFMPQASGAVKLLALQQIAKIMQPQDQAFLRYEMAANNADLRRSLAEESAATRLQIAGMQAGERGWQIVQTTDDKGATHTWRVQPSTGQREEIPGLQGATRLGQAELAKTRQALQDRMQDRIDARADKMRQAKSSDRAAQQKSIAIRDLYNQAESDIRAYRNSNPDATPQSDSVLAQMLEQRDQLYQELNVLAGRSTAVETPGVPVSPGGRRPREEPGGGMSQDLPPAPPGGL